MFKRKRESLDYDDNELPPLPEYGDMDDDKSGGNKKRLGRIVAVIVVSILAVCSGLYVRKQYHNPSLTKIVSIPTDGTVASSVQIDQGLIFAEYTVSGQRTRVYDVNDQEIVSPSEAIPLTLPVADTIKLSDGLNAIAYPEGAVYDATSGQLIVFGPPASPESNSSTDHFLTALRAIYNEQDPGVSIDPADNNITQNVRYIGQTEGTHFGWVMFEADRLMKTLSMGKDNISGAPATSSVPGFANMLDLELQLGDQGEGEVRRRFWFTVPDVEIEQDPDKQSMIISALSLKVETEYLDSKWETLTTQPPDPAGNAFAAHLTERYDEYAAEFPVFNDLRELAYWTALVHWLKQSDLPIQPELWLMNSPTPYNAPVTTPAITVTREEVQGNVVHTLSLWGGVDLGMQINIQPAQSSTQTHIKSVMDWFKARLTPGGAAMTEPDLRIAAITPMNSDDGSAMRIELPFDLGGYSNYLPGRQELYLPHIQRFGSTESPYFLFRDPVSNSPVILNFVGVDTQNNARVFINKKTGLRLEEFADAYQLRYGEFQLDDQFSYLENDYLLFDLEGRILQNARTGTSYTYNSERLASIRQGDDELKLDWNQDGSLQKIQSNSNHLEFEYQNGLLVALSDTQGATVRKFEYDSQGRLTHEYNGNDELKRLIRYDSQNRILFLMKNDQAVLYDWRPDGSRQLYSGASLKPWQTASDQDLSELKTILRLSQNPEVRHILFARQVGDKVIILADDRTYTISESLLKKPEQLRGKLANILGKTSAQDVVLISSGNVNSVAFHALFPDAIPLIAETVDENRIATNLALSKSLRIAPETASVINGLPSSSEELTNAQLDPNDADLWVGVKDKFSTLIKKANFSSPTQGKLKVQIESSLADRQSVLIIVAHSDGIRIYLPDGTPFDLDQLSEQQKQAIRTQAPLIILLSCDTASITDGSRSFSQKLLDLGARMVIAPNGKLPVNDAHDILRAIFANLETNPNALDALRQAVQSIYPDWLLPSDDGRDHSIEFHIQNFSPNIKEDQV